MIWKDDPIFLTEVDPWERFRIGTGSGSFNADPAKRKLLPGNQFPIEAYDAFLKQIVPRWLSTDEAIIDGLCRAHRQGLPVRDPRAQPGRPLRLPRRGTAP